MMMTALDERGSVFGWMSGEWWRRRRGGGALALKKELHHGYPHISPPS